MPQIVGWESARHITPVKVGDRFVELLPGLVRNYLVVQWAGRSYKLRVPFWVHQLLA